VVTFGASVSLAAFVLWQSQDPVHYLFILLLALISSAWRVGQLAFPGTSSISFVFIMIGIVHFSLAETLFLGCSSLMIQSWVERVDRAQTDTLVFRLSNLAISIAAADYVYRVSIMHAEANPVWPLMAGILAFTLMHTFAAAVTQALNLNRPVMEVWHECAYWTSPYYLLGGGIAVGITMLTQQVGWEYSMPVLPVIYFLYRGTFHHLERLRASHSGSGILTSHRNRTLETLGLAIAARFRAATDELSRAQTFALWLAKDLGLSRQDVEALRIAAVLHDVGTLAVPEQIICKSGKLTSEEFEKVKVHPVVGASIIERAEFAYPVAGIVRSHHERWDGRGYPDGLVGDQIPIGARVLSVIDCLVALTADRPYRRAIQLDRALAFIASQSGQAFDPKIVEAAMSRATDFSHFADTQQTTDETAASDSDADFVAPISDARRESQEIYALAQDLGRSMDFTETLATFCRRLASVAPFDSCCVYTLKDGTLLPRFATGSASAQLEALKIPLGAGPTGTAAKEGKPVINGDPSAETEESDALDLQSALSVPLEGAEGAIGVLTIYRRPKNAFSQNDLRILMGVRSILSSAIENSLRLQEAEASATTDYLTGLPNSKSLFQRLETESARCSRSGGHFTVLVCDLDGFKLVNDKHGHLMGNKVLQNVADMLQNNCREYDYVARMGGDEFVVLLAGLPASAVEARIRHLSLLVAEVAEETCPGCGVTLSAGQARYPAEGRDPEKLLAAADAKMYAVKQRRRISSISYGYDFDCVGS